MKEELHQLATSFTDLKTTNHDEVDQLKASFDELRNVVLALAQKDKDSSSSNDNGDGKQPSGAGEPSSGPIVCSVSSRCGERLRIENS